MYNINSGIEAIIFGDNVFSNPQSSKISGHRIVWEEAGESTYSIKSYDINTEIISLVNSDAPINFSIDSQTYPEISNDRVVWEAYDSGNDTYNIYLYDFSGYTIPIDLGISSYTPPFPKISNENIVWQEYNISKAKYDIYLHDLAGGTILVASNISSYTPPLPKISGDRIVWQEYNITNNAFDIYLYNPIIGISLISSEISISSQPNPVISDDQVVWVERRIDNDDVYLYNISTDTLTQITTDPADQNSPTISGNRIVWVDYRNDLISDIYMYTNGIQTTCPIANFSASPTIGDAPLAVQFFDQSSDPVNITAWKWNFGDGDQTNNSVQNPIHTYSSIGTYSPSLTVSNEYCRDAMLQPDYIAAGERPTANFSALPLSGYVPLTVSFTDTSSGSPDQWTWDFGDGYTSTQENPTHTYSSGGSYNVMLTANNSYGGSSLTRPAYISVLNRTGKLVSTHIRGLTIEDIGNRQYAQFDTTMFPNSSFTLSPDNTTLWFIPPPDNGIADMTLYSLDGIGFVHVNGIIQGNLSRTTCVSEHIALEGFSERIGKECSVSYELNLLRYPQNGTIATYDYEGFIPSDYPLFDMIASKADFGGISGIAYEVEFVLTNFAVPYNATINMSINSSWVDQVGSRNKTWVMRIGNDQFGEVLSTQFLYYDGGRNLDIFQATSPRGLSRFALAELFKSGNFFQLIQLFIQTHMIAGGGEASPEPVCTWTTNGQHYTAYNIKDCPTTVPPTSPIPQAPITSTLPLPTATPELTQALTTPTPIEEVMTPPMTPAPKVPEPVTPITIFSKFILNIVKWVTNNLAISVVVIAAVCIASYALWKRRQVY